MRHIYTNKIGRLTLDMNISIICKAKWLRLFFHSILHFIFLKGKNRTVLTENMVSRRIKRNFLRSFL